MDTTPKRVIYGESNYATIVAKNGYFVDKTAYIAKLEETSNPVFLRPRRFGKSLFCSVLRYYYDLNYATRFSELFGQTRVGQQPTPNHNQFIHHLLFWQSTFPCLCSVAQNLFVGIGPRLTASHPPSALLLSTTNL